MIYDQMEVVQERLLQELGAALAWTHSHRACVLLLSIVCLMAPTTNKLVSSNGLNDWIPRDPKRSYSPGVKINIAYEHSTISLRERATPLLHLTINDAPCAIDNNRAIPQR